MNNSSFRFTRKKYNQDSSQYLVENAAQFMPLLSELEKVMEIAVLKATGQLIDPAMYPMPVTEIPALEHLILPRLLSLSQQKKEIAISNFASRIKKINILSDADYSGLYSYGVMESLNKPVPVFETAKELLSVKANNLGQYLNTQYAAQALQTHTMSDSNGMQVSLRIHKIKCVDETDPETGDDEISLAATIVEPNGNTRKIEPILIRDDFDTGEERVYEPAWNFFTYNLWERFDTAPFPRYCGCLFILSELDNGGLPEKVEEIYTFLRDAVVAALGRYAGGAIISGVFAGPLGIVIGIAVGYLLDKLFDLFKEIWEDDMFPPQNIDKYFKDKYSNFDGSFFTPVSTCVIQGFGGIYTIDYSWQMKGILETIHGLGDGWEPAPETLSGAIIYKNTYYDGDSKFLAPGKYSLGGRLQRMRYQLPSPFDNDIDSIKVGKGYYATLYKTDDYTGDSIEIYYDTPTPYFNDDWRDQVSSIIVGRLTDRIG